MTNAQTRNARTARGGRFVAVSDITPNRCKVQAIGTAEECREAVEDRGDATWRVLQLIGETTLHDRAFHAGDVAWSKIQRNTVEEARIIFVGYCSEIGSHHVTEEDAILNACGREFSPECARDVLDGKPATVDYYAWLLDQTKQAQREHERSGGA